MKINPKIRETINEIAEESVRYANDSDTQYKYIRRFLHLYDNGLSLEERVYLVASILEVIHYRNLVTDHDTMLNIADVKLRTFMGVALITVFTMIVAAILFKTNSHLNRVVEVMFEFTKILSL